MLACIRSALLPVVAFSSCQALLPSHSKSLDTDGERVEIRMLRREHIKNNPEYLAAYKLAFDDDLQKAAPILVPAAVALAGLLIDSAKHAVEREASLYEAQWGRKTAFDEFWTGEEPTYRGFEITRRTKSTDPSFTLACGFAPSKDGQVFRVAPLYLKVDSVKAKVLSDEWWTWYSFLWKALLHTGHKIDLNVDIEIGGVWRDAEKATTIAPLSTFSISVPDYDLSIATPLTYGKGLDEGVVGWMPGIPRSVVITKNGQSPGSGTFWIKTLVTERDPSNAAKYLDRLAEVIGQQKEKIITVIQKELAPASQPSQD